MMRTLKDTEGVLMRGFSVGLIRCVSRSRVFGLPALGDGPRGPRGCPKTAKEAPNSLIATSVLGEEGERAGSRHARTHLSAIWARERVGGFSHSDCPASRARRARAGRPRMCGKQKVFSSSSSYPFLCCDCDHVRRDLRRLRRLGVGARASGSPVGFRTSAVSMGPRASASSRKKQASISAPSSAA